MLGHGTVGQFAIGEVALATAETVTIDKWLPVISDPVRVKDSRSARQQVIAFPPYQTTSVDRWLPVTADPIRVKGSIVARQQAFVSPLYQTITVDSWVPTAIDRHRVKKFSISPHQTFVFPALVPVLFDIFNSTSSPVFEWRLQYQRTAFVSVVAATPPPTPTPTPVTLRRAIVSVIEIVPQSGIVGHIEIAAIPLAGYQLDGFQTDGFQVYADSELNQPVTADVTARVSIIEVEP